MTHFTGDVVVIGAGIIGAACSYRLAEAGFKVTVLEQDSSPATGSTARSAAGVRVQFQERVNIELSRISIEEYRCMKDADLREIGYLMLVPEERWEAHEKGIALQQSLGLPVQALSPLEAQQILPFETHDLVGCSYCPTDGAVDPHGITFHYLREARKHGATLHVDTRVTGIRHQQGIWTLSTSKGTFQAPVVVNATGAWAREVGEMCGLDVPITPARRMVFCTGPLEETHHFPMTFDLKSGVWLRSEGQRVIFGRANPSDSGFRTTLDWDWLEPTLEAAFDRFPWFEKLHLDRKASWYGHYEMTPDGQAILGRMPGVAGWFNACGFSGHGVMQAAATGRVIAQEVLGQELLVNIDPLRIDRFAHATPLREDIQV
ncbi:NAD(P)/FAD-dependent oxidoreductase [Deinococcus cellulosilyticus]|uniref:FAD-dependent oxidoreductase n=1 Tax=Deinococcus cellulosilyticus (strain DSM 18568 / NBRC 106333 / KACC 11606 / 5516J-15) TaxID=1223518 RepID=A0A511N029_DEIC1|nr:FAD-dependent oxidoreductase [Deinococcus cellulosilyticus]GEM46230.1 FAD-dependent oxidoreductase [Deinococcus cellulosilyticus NBRC 106333 = KACC 11606]